MKAKEREQLLEALLDPPSGTWVCRHLDFSPGRPILNFLPTGTVSLYVCVVVSCKIYGNLLQRPRETNTARWEKTERLVLGANGRQRASLYCSQQLQQQEATFLPSPREAKRD